MNKIETINIFSSENIIVIKKKNIPINVLDELSKTINFNTESDEITINRKDLTQKQINNINKYVNKLNKENNKKTTIDEDKDIYTSFYEDSLYMFEQVYDGTKSKFLKFNKETKKIEYIDDIDMNGYFIKPIIGEEVSKCIIKLPTESINYINDDTLDNEIKTFINKWLDIPENELQFAIWNIKRSWVYEKFNSLNYLRALGDTGQGKSRYLITLGSLHYKPIFISGNTTAAPVFRLIDKWRGTMIIDEADWKESDETNDIIKIINQGFEKGTYIPRCDQTDAKIINFFNPFCPKILGTRKIFSDQATENRCVTSIMNGTSRTDILFSLNNDFFKESTILRNKLLQWRLDNFNNIKEYSSNNELFISLEPRTQQILSSYVLLFNNNPLQMEKLVLIGKKMDDDLFNTRSESWEGQIINSLKELYDKGEIYISVSDIIENGQLKDKRGNLYKPRSLSKTLKLLGFEKTKLIRIDNNVISYIPIENKNHLMKLFSRYCKRVNDVNIKTQKNNDFKIFDDKINDILL